MKNVQVVTTDGKNELIKCKHYHKTSQGYLFVLENTTKHFPLNVVKEIVNPFVLPNGKVSPK